MSILQTIASALPLFSHRSSLLSNTNVPSRTASHTSTREYWATLFVSLAFYPNICQLWNFLNKLMPLNPVVRHALASLLRVSHSETRLQRLCTACFKKEQRGKRNKMHVIALFCFASIISEQGT